MPEFIQEMKDKVVLISKRMKAAQDRQSSYANKRRRPLEFQVGDYVFQKVSPFRGAMIFGRKGKLSPRYIGPYMIVEKIVKILDRREKQLRNKTIPLVMVQWSRHGTEEATWEIEAKMRQEWPHLFQNVVNFSVQSDYPMNYQW
ncbi:uncharacterized protein [Henckelia pumila]|uniref:uncharacterized protein n=1 Tax=Henckelia pumila TaxID=405737 RepID=UPI003C6DF9FF